MKIKCDKCRNIAVWFYMPSDGNYNYCDKHVPRGCSCVESERDDKGREVPCCEYMYEERGMEDDEKA